MPCLFYCVVVCSRSTRFTRETLQTLRGVTVCQLIHREMVARWLMCRYDLSMPPLHSCKVANLDNCIPPTQAPPTDGDRTSGTVGKALARTVNCQDWCLCSGSIPLAGLRDLDPYSTVTHGQHDDRDSTVHHP